MEKKLFSTVTMMSVMTIFAILFSSLFSSSSSFIIVVNAQVTNATTNSSGTNSSVNATTTTTTEMSTTSTTVSNSSGNATVSPTTSTPMPSANTSSAAPVAGLGPVDIRPIRNVSCPFSRWQGEPRYCYECRWCPFRQSTCCEMEDEIAVLKSVNVSGSTDWDCFITIVHFQQCGRCDPRSLTFLMNKTLNYVWDPRGVAIRPCKQACKYIHKQCKDAKTLTGARVVPENMDENLFCADYPEISSDEIPCFESAGAVSFFAMILISIIVVFVTMF